MIAAAEMVECAARTLETCLLDLTTARDALQDERLTAEEAKKNLRDCVTLLDEATRRMTQREPQTCTRRRFPLPRLR